MGRYRHTCQYHLLSGLCTCHFVRLGRISRPGLALIAVTSLLLSGLSLSGCAAPELTHWAEHYQLDSVVVDSKPIALKALLSKQARTPASNRLHIYIEGDGEPFLNSLTVAPDPTPQDPLMLHLLAKDPAPSAYLTRPCYFGMQAECLPTLWTLARYSPIVVQSMANAIEILATDYSQIILIGHSGGGTLATLLAPRISKVTHVVTLAGNLDIELWTRHHALTPLSASMNPREQAPLPRRVRQIHYVGRNDKNILPQWTADFARLQPNAQVIVLDFNHRCCWEGLWPQLLDQALEDSVLPLP